MVFLLKPPFLWSDFSKGSPPQRPGSCLITSTRNGSSWRAPKTSGWLAPEPKKRRNRRKRRRRKRKRRVTWWIERYQRISKVLFDVVWFCFQRFFFACFLLFLGFRWLTISYYTIHLRHQGKKDKKKKKNKKEKEKKDKKAGKKKRKNKDSWCLTAGVSQFSMLHLIVVSRLARDIKSDALAMPEGLFRLRIAMKLMRDGAKEIGFGLVLVGTPQCFTMFCLMNKLPLIAF